MLCPATFTTQPSGARLPLRIAKPPVDFSGLSFLRTTSLSGSFFGRGRFFAERFPRNGQRFAFSNPASIIRLAISAVPPAANKSVATNRPPGFKSARIGVLRADAIEVFN